MAASTQGSWYPSGFHGHFRSKMRNDFVNEYRMQAKPSPPMKFSRRLSERPTTHNFSKHDNRFSFLNTVTSFQDGLGKKKLEVKQKGAYQPDFIAWVPHAKDIKSAGPSVSSYRNDYKTGATSRSVPQILINSVRRPNTAMPIDPKPPIDERPLTTYRFVHRHLQPNPRVNTNMNTGDVEDRPVPFVKTHQYINTAIPSVYDRKTSLTNLRRSRAASAPLMRESVAMCLQWYVPKSEIVTPLSLVGNENRAAVGPLKELSQVQPKRVLASTNESFQSPPILMQTAPPALQQQDTPAEMVPSPPTVSMPVSMPAPLPPPVVCTEPSFARTTPAAPTAPPVAEPAPQNTANYCEGE
ncbi:uncharacterized protein LOC100371168 [Saccoglossus kowalevskii]|uniref:Uncharacterized protein LOC100371168 n=1 Tax=Saccoglossus kowalevskii TaxID=10224 RepID=A0ABM0GVQ3_SACKO|nr:PREDICTED: uncharacterized protein LOC100371168 [Saccoglossus kowalevskii]